MGTDQQVSMGIHLQQVPVQGIKHQSPAPHSCQWMRGSFPLPSLGPPPQTDRVGKVGSYL